MVYLGEPLLADALAQQMLPLFLTHVVEAAGTCERWCNMYTCDMAACLGCGLSAGCWRPPPPPPPPPNPPHIPSDCNGPYDPCSSSQYQLLGTHCTRA